MKRQCLSIGIAAVMLAGSLPASLSASADNGLCIDFSSSNVGAQNYTTYGSTVKSYLSKTSDGLLMRVQNEGSSGAVSIEYYDTEYNLQSTKTVAEELPIFGGFYETDSNYFLVSGQENSDENDELEVYRVTKYDKNWNRLGSVGLYGANTVLPFSAGSCRMDSCGKYLIVRTCHEMYTTSDGYNHQASVTFEVDTDSMEITDSSTDISYISTGYVSHSFNQFVKISDNCMVTLDHGDAYPRSFVILENPNDVSDGEYSSYSCTSTTVISFKGETGENATRASVGGFEISDSSYLVAGNTIVQDDNYKDNTTRNVFVASVDKKTKEVSVNNITDYSDGTTSTPQFVELNTNEYMLLWTRESNVYYTEIDGNGNQVGEIYSLKGNLSDCKPLVTDGKVIWYTYQRNDATFYEINTSDFSKTDVTEVTGGHDYEILSVTDGVASIKCSKCGDAEEKNVITSMSFWWNTSGQYNSYSSAFPSSVSVGDNLYYLVSGKTSDADTELEYIYDKEALERVEVSSGTNEMGYFKILKSGSTTITIRPKLNPSYSKTFTVKATSPLDVTNASLSIQNDLTVKFYASQDLDSKYSNPYAVISQDKADGTTVGTTVNGVKNGEYYEFDYSGVNVKEVGDKLHITIYGRDSDGNLASGAKFDYSVKEYCMNILSKSDSGMTALGFTTDAQKTAVRQLLADLLNYSSEAQKYFGYNTGSLANADMSAKQQAYATSDSATVSLSNVTNVKYSTIDNPTAEWYAAGLNLLNTTNIRVVFKYSGDISGVTISVKPEGYSESKISEIFDAGDGYYYALYDGVSASKYAVPIDFTIYQNGKAISNTLRYSVESYASNMWDNASLSELLPAMVKYGKSAENYVEVMGD